MFSRVTRVTFAGLKIVVVTLSTCKELMVLVNYFSVFCILANVGICYVFCKKDTAGQSLGALPLVAAVHLC